MALKRNYELFLIKSVGNLFFVINPKINTPVLTRCYNIIISAYGQEIAELFNTSVTDANFVFA
ncbi:MAG: hypothetical protein DSM107014_06105 [Gomphosphaeria aponina SAG 52.96 = DSM 107014]|uniref:Uncharacterized protein n=1 Tax=Gomphosphaeria aponina SAG 52.96 = DSM 107014 TaxID=1521640 RepID=A0A941GNM0_9CHRO|nr:hypothetical protein [Gomphosphaeria aponina SAG 52.96 = DSM 107014]